MRAGVVDLFSGQFWAVVAVAIALLVPLRSARVRVTATAAINLAFVAILVGQRVLGVVVGVLVVHLVLRALTRAALAKVAFLSLLGSSVGLLVLHKLPALAPDAFSPASSVLVAVGFSYVALRIVDVARAVYDGRHTAPGPLELLNYLVPFHMLAAGPIQSYDEYVALPAVPAKASPRDVLEGLERIAHGMFKKFVIAFAIERVFLTQFMTEGWQLLLEIQLYAVWFYLDFSAYSDIAVGIGKLAGVPVPENFDRPYVARNMTDFWERWHITLSQWIRRNLFIVTQLALLRRTGGRRQLLVASVSIAVAFLLAGLWHGVSLPFFAWGLMHGIGVMVANLYRAFLRKRLGATGVRTYMSRRWVRVLATAITVEYVALSLMVVGWHWEAS